MAKKFNTKNIRASITVDRVPKTSINFPRAGYLYKAEDSSQNLETIRLAININASEIATFNDFITNLDSDDIPNKSTKVIGSNVTDALNTLHDDIAAGWDYDAEGNVISNVGTPIKDTDVATKGYTDSKGLPSDFENKFQYDDTYLSLFAFNKTDTRDINASIKLSNNLINLSFGSQGGFYITPFGGIRSFLEMNMNVNKITNLKEGVDPTDAITKSQLDKKGLPEELEKRIDYSNAGNTLLYSADKKTPNVGSGIYLEPAEIDVVVKDRQVMTITEDNIDVASDMTLNDNKISDVTNPTAPQDVSTKDYVDGKISPLTNKTQNLDARGRVISTQYNPTRTPQAIATQKVVADNANKWDYDAKNNKITNLGDGVNPQDGVTKKQLDAKGSGLGSLITNNENNLNLAHQNIQLKNLEIGQRIIYRDYSDKGLSAQHIIIDNTQKDIPLPYLDTWITEYDFVVSENGTYNIKQLFYYKLLFTTPNKKFRISSGIHNTTTGVIKGPQEQDFDFSDLDNDKDIKDQVFNWFKETIVDLKVGITYQFKMTIQGLDNTEGTFSPAVYTSAPHVYDLTEKSHLEIQELVPKGSGSAAIPITVKDFNKVAAQKNFTFTFDNIAKAGATTQQDVGNKADEFSIGSTTYQTDVIKVRVYDIINYRYTTVLDTTELIYYIPIDEINSNVNNFKEQYLKTRVGGNYFFSSLLVSVSRLLNGNLNFAFTDLAISDSATTKIKKLSADISLLKLKGSQGIKGDKGDPGPAGHREYSNTNFQQFKSTTYPTDRRDNTFSTITGWVESSVKSKTIFTTQSNGAFVIDETYRQEINDSATDRFIKVEFKFDGFIDYRANYTARFDVSGVFDFGGDKNILNRTQVGGSSYLSASSGSVHSTTFRIPHTITAGDLMWLEIKAQDISQADMRPPYHLSFTELGSDGAKGEKGDPGTSGSPKLGKVNNVMDSINLATQNLVSNVGENLKEGGAEFFQSYQYADLPETSVVIDAVERNIPFPKGTDAWENVLTFTPKNISTYMFKNLFFFNLNPFANDNKKFQIKQTLTDTDGTEYTNLIKYDLNDIEDTDIQTNKFSHFSKFFESIDPTKAPYNYTQTIQGLEGSTSSLLIDTESTGGDSLYPAASHMSIIEMIPSGTVFAYDKDVEISDPNDYTYYGFDPSTGSNIVAALQYAMSETQYGKLLGRVVKIGEDADKNITKVLIESPVDIGVNNQKIVDLAPGVLDTDAINLKQLKDASGVAAKQSYKDLVSVDKFLLDAYSNTLSGFSRGVWKTADLGLITTFESWVDGTQIVTDQLKLTLTNAKTGAGTLPNGKEFFIDIKNIETSDTIQDKVMDDLTHEYLAETVSIKFNLRKNATNIFLDVVCYTEGSAVGTLTSIDIEIDLIKLKGVKSIKGDKGDPAPAPVRETIYNRTLNIEKQKTNYLLDLPDLMLYKNIMISIASPTLYWYINVFITDLNDLPDYAAIPNQININYVIYSVSAAGLQNAALTYQKKNKKVFTYSSETIDGDVDFKIVGELK